MSGRWCGDLGERCKRSQRCNSLLMHVRTTVHMTQSCPVGLGWRAPSPAMSVGASPASNGSSIRAWQWEQVSPLQSAVRNAALRERGKEVMQARFGPLVPPP